ncbi:MAG: biopolymer transporter ExbD [Prevotella sp.]|jgi:biopolymer transport protein ExbD|nr:biopolymer transporter ExbD [Prevotella sp.]MBQ1587830.1 biopolymer transporter ExbD [Prevotella sp.]MBQ1627110.1 biopolymer transporter ExbD [Prevotella sp.]MBQ1646842.1 biopolymer transporter ExbD [Prevotella sp.]MBQ1700969.1 biopolymer transporter ExbD [Prevotella sp.]
MAKKKESKQKKMTVRVDFTPMVDMLMLLITFFMLCTSLSKPSTMELTMPSNDENQTEDQKQEAKASQTVTLYVTADDKIYYVEYDNDGTAHELQETTWGDAGIRDVLRNHVIADGTRPVNQILLAVERLKNDRKANPLQYNDSTYQKELNKIKKGELKEGKVNTLTIVIKPTDNATFKNMIDALDEMQILSIGTYVIDKITPDDVKLLEEKGVKL